MESGPDLVSVPVGERERPSGHLHAVGLARPQGMVALGSSELTAPPIRANAKRLVCRVNLPIYGLEAIQWLWIAVFEYRALPGNRDRDGLVCRKVGDLMCCKHHESSCDRTFEMDLHRGFYLPPLPCGSMRTIFRYQLIGGTRQPATCTR